MGMMCLLFLSSVYLVWSNEVETTKMWCIKAKKSIPAWTQIDKKSLEVGLCEVHVETVENQQGSSALPQDVLKNGEIITRIDEADSLYTLQSYCPGDIILRNDLITDLISTSEAQNTHWVFKLDTALSGALRPGMKIRFRKPDNSLIPASEEGLRLVSTKAIKDAQVLHMFESSLTSEEKKVFSLFTSPANKEVWYPVIEETPKASCSKTNLNN